MKKKQSERIEALEKEVKKLRERVIQEESERHLIAIGQRVTRRLLELGPDKVDLELIAKLNAALGCDIMPIAATKPSKKKK